MYLLAIDCGTQSTIVSLINEQGLEIIKAHRNQIMQSLRPGWATQEPLVWWNNAV